MAYNGFIGCDNQRISYGIGPYLGLSNRFVTNSEVVGKSQVFRQDCERQLLLWDRLREAAASVRLDWHKSNLRWKVNRHGAENGKRKRTDSTCAFLCQVFTAITASSASVLGCIWMYQVNSIYRTPYTGPLLNVLHVCSCSLIYNPAGRVEQMDWRGCSNYCSLNDERCHIWSASNLCKYAAVRLKGCIVVQQQLSFMHVA